MPEEKKNRPPIDSFDELAGAVGAFDYRVDPDDFVVYELGRLMEEDRASFDDAEFRCLIDEGISGHVEENPAVRAELAGLLRERVPDMEPDTRQLGIRVIAALENVEVDLRNVGLVVRTYTEYLFRQLQHVDDAGADEQERASKRVALWKTGALGQEQVFSELLATGRPAVASLADLLFDAPEDRPGVTLALSLLEAIPCPTSARILAHAVSEPILEEDLEEKASSALRRLWPLPRRYMLYSLGDHTHEDLPFRWFELFVAVNETTAADRTIEELMAHSSDARFQEDLAALLGILLQSHDPEIEEKILHALNDPRLGKPAAGMLEIFLREYRPPKPLEPTLDPWAREKHLIEINRRYLSAAKLLDTGRRAEAVQALEDILVIEPGYPFAEMLKDKLQNSRFGSDSI
jgi:hypothetical protein